MQLDRLAILADNMGLTITYHQDGPKGFYDDRTRHISIRADVTKNYREHVWTLAHELGHAANHHRPTTDPTLNARQELQANRYAAALLIKSADYALAETLTGGHPGAIANELDLPRHAIEFYQQHSPHAQKVHHAWLA